VVPRITAKMKTLHLPRLVSVSEQRAIDKHDTPSRHFKLAPGKSVLFKPLNCEH